MLDRCFKHPRNSISVDELHEASCGEHLAAPCTLASAAFRLLSEETFSLCASSTPWSFHNLGACHSM